MPKAVDLAEMKFIVYFLVCCYARLEIHSYTNYYYIIYLNNKTVINTILPECDSGTITASNAYEYSIPESGSQTSGMQFLLIVIQKLFS